MVFDFEKSAMMGEPVPIDLDIADACLYMGLKHLYAMYKERLIDRSTATEEKKKLIFCHKENKAQLEFLNRESEALKSRIQEASENYKNNRTLENADKLYAAFYNLPENWRDGNE